MPTKLIVDNVSVPIKRIQFSDGGTNIKLEVPQQLIDHPPSAYYSISVDLDTPVDNYLWEILLLDDAIQNTFGMSFKRRLLHLPYLPHGRADRVFEKGNPAPLNLFLTTIEPYFDEIFLTDPHSDFYRNFEEWVDFTVKAQHQCFIEVVGNKIKSGDVLIAPDKGSLNKIYKLQQALDYRTVATFVVEAGKRRDIETGRVIETTLPDMDLKGKSVWIVDDICDGAGSFIPLAKKLKEVGAREVNLYVTHGIFSKGLDILKEYIDNIHTYQMIGKFVTMKDIQQFNEEI